MDEPSFHALYERTAAPLRAYVARVLGGATNADDIVQDAYMRLLRSPPATRDQQELRALVFRIASNLIVDHWCRRRREGASIEDRLRAVGRPDADATLRVDMERTFEQLKLQQRQLMWMVYVEGNDHREIAAALGLRERSVRVLLFRARRKLAKLLAGGGRGNP
jgi:RNA polymerase sigma-70 factor (ECF subfamily)